MADQKDPATLRHSMVTLALKEVGHGHYLLGTAGNIPGGEKGAPIHPTAAEMHPNVPDLSKSELEIPRHTDVHFVTLFTAYNKGRGEVCMGRWDKVKSTVDRAINLTSNQALKFTVKTITEEQFRDLQAAAAHDHEKRWPRPNNRLNAKDHAVWAESCEGHRHFDCIGLINWAIWKVTGQNAQLSIPFVRKDRAFVEISSSKVLPGDLALVGDKHIGLVVDERTVVEAADKPLGVLTSSIDGRWDTFYRLPKRYLRFGV